MSLTLFALFKLFQLSKPQTKTAQLRAVITPVQENEPHGKSRVLDKDQNHTLRIEPRSESTLSLHKARPLTPFQIQAMEGALGKPMHERTLARPAHKRLPSQVRGNASSSKPIIVSNPGFAPKALRVSRVIDAGVSRHHAGRMVLSGSMQAVCAELDRLTAL